MYRLFNQPQNNTNTIGFIIGMLPSDINQIIVKAKQWYKNIGHAIRRFLILHNYKRF